MVKQWTQHNTPDLKCTIVGAPRSDLTLLKVGQGTLESAGVLTGRYMFEVGDNERHSATSRTDPKL